MKSIPQDKTNLDPNLEDELTVPLSMEVDRRRINCIFKDGS